MRDFVSYFKETGEIGYVQAVMSSIFYVNGLPNARINELVLTENGLIGIVKAVLPELVEVMIFEGHNLLHNMKVVRTNQYLTVPVSDKFLGRVIDPFGLAADGKPPLAESEVYFREIDPEVLPYGKRSRIKRHFETGVLSVDMQVPLGYGQRELLLGDTKTGKTFFALQTIAHQVKKGTICIYVSCGKKKSDLKMVQNYFEKMGISGKIIIVVASSSDPAPMVYLAPFAAFSIAEHFRDQGKDVLVVVDDMTTHAKFHREISLLSKRPPGRQSYPGDIFHLQARIAERAGNFILKDGHEATITFLPLAETLEGDLTGYIQTNLMAMTDGHLYFDVAEIKRGRLPAISYTLSVSRVGNQTKKPYEIEIKHKFTTLISEAKRAEELGKFGVELTEQTMKALENSKRLDILFEQQSGELIDRDLGIILAGLFLGGYWQSANEHKLKEDKAALIAAYERGVLDKLRLKLSQINSYDQLIRLTTSISKGQKQQSAGWQVK